MYFYYQKYHKLLFIILLAVTTIVTLIDQFTSKLQHQILHYLLGPAFWQFLLGIFGAYLSITYHKLISYKLSLSIAITCLVFFVGISITFMHPSSYIVYGLLSSMIVLFFTAYEQERSVNKRFSYYFKIIGDASYGIYLFGPIITIMIYPSNDFFKIIIIISTIIFSIFFNQFVENKFLTSVRKAIYNIFPKSKCGYD